MRLFLLRVPSKINIAKRGISLTDLLIQTRSSNLFDAQESVCCVAHVCATSMLFPCAFFSIAFSTFLKPSHLPSNYFLLLIVFSLYGAFLCVGGLRSLVAPL